MNIHKGMTNVEIAKLLKAVAACYQLQGKAENKFKIVAYERAADAVEHLSSEAKDLWDDGKLEEVSGIGKSIAGHLGEIFKNGNSKHFDKVMKGYPAAIFDLVEVSGIGAKTALVLTKKLDISSQKPLKDLLKKARDGQISKLEGFGKDSEDAIIKSIKELEGREKRMLLNYALQVSETITDWLKGEAVIEKVDALGSLRRKASTVGDIDIAVATTNPQKAIEHFCKYPKASRVLERGMRTASIILPGNIQVDLMVQEPDSYGATLQHFTGSKHHNIALREFALKLGVSLNEYGIRKIKDQKSKVKINNKRSKLLKFIDEESFYNYLGLEWVPPELREDTGEIEAALSQKLPRLVDLKDIKSDLHLHSDYDIETSHDLGASSMEDIIRKADSFGYEYIAFTEHNPSQSGHNEKQIVEILERKKEEVDKLNANIKDIAGINNIKKMFNSLEIDILPDGRLPVDDSGLSTLDFALVSIHSSFRQSRKKMTQRVLSALGHPKVKVFAHPTGRKLNEREGVELDWEQVFDFCLKNDKWLEINCDPMRLDLPDILVRDAVKRGVAMTLSTDAHHTDHMDNAKYGVYVARRGWATPSDIINTKSLDEFEKMLG